MVILIEDRNIEILPNGSSFSNPSYITICTICSDPTDVYGLFLNNNTFSLLEDDSDPIIMEYRDVHCVYLYHNQEIGVIYDAEKDKYITEYGDIITISLLK